MSKKVPRVKLRNISQVQEIHEATSLIFSHVFLSAFKIYVNIIKPFIHSTTILIYSIWILGFLYQLESDLKTTICGFYEKKGVKMKYLTNNAIVLRAVLFIGLFYLSQLCQWMRSFNVTIQRAYFTFCSYIFYGFFILPQKHNQWPDKMHMLLFTSSHLFSRYFVLSKEAHNCPKWKFP